MDLSTHAFARFGLGGALGDAKLADPRGWALSQIGPGDPLTLRGLLDTPAALGLIKRDREWRKADPAAADAAKLQPNAMKQDASAQLQAALTAAAPFRERLVWFWSNHFTVSTRRGVETALIGPFVREAIRPNVTSRFADMLRAVMRHPAMLLYLDNASSIGPDSPAGEKNHQGLNENLARESLELHTVTPAAGYTQADVTSYAAILTGWGVDFGGPSPGFRFHPHAHEPGPKTLLGRTFPEGEDGGLAALDFLATHPATYRAIATRLAQHFCADDPPQDAVGRIEAALAETGGDLGAASRAVIAEPAAWRPLTKLRTPLDYAAAAMRATGVRDGDGEKLLGVLYALGQPFWSAPLPNGWSDRAADWDDPETLLRRADWSFRLSGRAAGLDPDDAAAAALGAHLRPETRTAMDHAASRREALTLLLSSPEFMRR